MAVRTRFIRSVVQASKSDAVKMPWTRGVLRKIARDGQITPPKVRKLYVV